MDKMQEMATQKLQKLINTQYEASEHYAANCLKTLYDEDIQQWKNNNTKKVNPNKFSFMFIAPGFYKDLKEEPFLESITLDMFYDTIEELSTKKSAQEYLKEIKDFKIGNVLIDFGHTLMKAGSKLIKEIKLSEKAHREYYNAGLMIVLTLFEEAPQVKKQIKTFLEDGFVPLLAVVVNKKVAIDIIPIYPRPDAPVPNSKGVTLH